MDKKQKLKNFYNVRKLSIRAKILIQLFIMTLIISSAAVVISFKSYGDAIDEHYKSMSSQVAKTAASQMDAEAISRYFEEYKNLPIQYDMLKYEGDEETEPDEDYIEEFDEQVEPIKDEEYNHLLKILFDIKEANNVEYLYVQKLDGNDSVYIFDADNSESVCQLGTTHPIMDAVFETENPEYGIPAFISRGSYGWLCSAFEPIYGEDGKPVALVGVDISMNDVMQDKYEYLRRVILIMLVEYFMMVVVMGVVTHFTIVHPINILAAAASGFTSDKDKFEEGSETSISRLNIKTGDELENLSDAFKSMEKDINNYITNLTTVTAEKERIGTELSVATHIQSSMLPCIFPPYPDRDEFDIYATMNPAKEVGGDFYDFFMIDNRHLAIVMADVSGKGVPAALFMVIGKTLIKDHAQNDLNLNKVFDEVNNKLCEANSEGMFITAFAGILDLVTGEFTYVNAGHEMPFIRKKDGKFEALKIRPGFVLAGMENIHYKTGSITLEPGDMVFQYTDGVTEATDAHNELFGMERLSNALNEITEEDTHKILDNVKKRVDEFVAEAPQFDDITMLCLDYKKKMVE